MYNTGMRKLLAFSLYFKQKAGHVTDILFYKHYCYSFALPLVRQSERIDIFIINIFINHFLIQSELRSSLLIKNLVFYFVKKQINHSILNYIFKLLIQYFIKNDEYLSNYNKFKTVFEKLKYFKPLKVLQAHSDYVQSVHFSFDGANIVSSSFDKTIKIWDVKSGNIIKELKGDFGCACDAKFSPDGNTI
ncbi:WD-40 repeat protein, partial [Reticulomyxa filosa]